MPRKTTKSLQRRINPDRKYNSVLVQRLINKSMLNGKKMAAEANGLLSTRNRCQEAKL